MAPNRDVVKPECVPPQIKHGSIEAQDSFFSDTCRRRRESCQPIVDQDSLTLVDTRQQMPERECVAFTRLGKNHREISSPLLRCAVFKIESRQSSAELRGSILKVRCAGTDLRPGRAGRAS